MDTKNIEGLVSFVSILGWKPEIKDIVGTNADAFYDAFVAQDPQRAYKVALQSRDPVFLQAITERIIQRTVGGTDVESAIRDMYINSSLPAALQTVATPLPSRVPSSGFSIESLNGRYRIHGVLYEGNCSVVDISKELLNNGASHTQSDWIEMARQGEWKLPSGPLYFAVLGALYDNKDADNVGEVKEMLAKDFRDHFMITSTRVRYSNNGLDTVVHDFGYATERREEANIVGGDGYINETSGFDAAMGALVGINDCQKVGSVGSWITGKKIYLYRVNSKPEKDTERALVLGHGSGWFIVSADGGIVGSWPARGMVARLAENSP